jgi:hypothetical protein
MHDDGTVTPGSYTGYIDIGARHLFFYFFESRNKFSGPMEVCASLAIVSSTTCHTGPGCSSSLGLFMERS